MDHYVDIRLLADPEMGCNQLMAHLFYKVHVWLAAHGNGRVGLSFPEMNKTPGSVLRVHGSADQLQEFLAGDWRKSLALWLAPMTIKPVPADTGYCVVRRIQRKSAHNRRKRSVAKGWLTESEARERIPDSTTQKLDLPFLDIRSSSTGQQRVRFFIQQTPAPAMVRGEFTAYGMSAGGATVPRF